MMIIKTHEILCSFLAILMLVLASHVSTTTAASPASVPRVDSMDDGISASLRKGIRGFFSKRHGGDAGSSFTTPITGGMDPKLMLQRSVPASGSSASSDNPANNNGSVGSVGVSLDHQKDSGGDHHSSSEQQHHEHEHEHEHDQKHNKDKKGSSSTTGGNNKGRKFKVCMTHNHCYKKKLVCPKKCGKKSSSPTPSSSSRLLLIPNHFPGHNNHCVLNCKKCVAHC